MREYGGGGVRGASSLSYAKSEKLSVAWFDRLLRELGRWRGVS